MHDEKQEYFSVKQVILTEEVRCNNAPKFSDYTLQEHLHFLGFGLTKEEEEILMGVRNE